MLLKVFYTLYHHLVSKMYLVIGRHYAAENIILLIVFYCIRNYFQVPACKYNTPPHYSIRLWEQLIVKYLQSKILYDFFIVLQQPITPWVNDFLLHGIKFGYSLYKSFYN